MVGSEYDMNHMSPWTRHDLCQQSRLVVMVLKGIFSSHTLDPLIPAWFKCHSVYLNIDTDHVPVLMTTVYSSSNGCFHQNECGADKYAEMMGRNHVNMEQNLKGSFPSHL